MHQIQTLCKSIQNELNSLLPFQEMTMTNRKIELPKQMEVIRKGGQIEIVRRWPKDSMPLWLGRYPVPFSASRQGMVFSSSW